MFNIRPRFGDAQTGTLAAWAPVEPLAHCSNERNLERCLTVTCTKIQSIASMRHCAVVCRPYWELPLLFAPQGDFYYGSTVLSDMYTNREGPLPLLNNFLTPLSLSGFAWACACWLCVRLYAYVEQCEIIHYVNRVAIDVIIGFYLVLRRQCMTQRFS